MTWRAALVDDRRDVVAKGDPFLGGGRRRQRREEDRGRRHPPILAQFKLKRVHFWAEIR
jgi:hypothetical protein